LADAPSGSKTGGDSASGFVFLFPSRGFVGDAIARVTGLLGTTA
jgi:hypothetical protein